MNSEIAYWTLSTMAIVTVTLMGFLLVALLFYLEGSIRQIKETGRLPLGKPLGMILFSIIMLAIGVWNAYSGVVIIHNLPGSSVELNELTSGQVDSQVGAFKSFLGIVVLYASYFIVVGAWEVVVSQRGGKKKGEKKMNQSKLGRWFSMKASKEAFLKREEERIKGRSELLEKFRKLIPAPTPAECQMFVRLIDIEDTASDRAKASEKRQRRTSYLSLGAAGIAGFFVPLVDIVSNRLPFEEGWRYLIGPIVPFAIIGVIMWRTHVGEKWRQQKEDTDLKAQQTAVDSCDSQELESESHLRDNPPGQ